MSALLDHPLVGQDRHSAPSTPVELALAAARERLPGQVLTRAGAAARLRAAGYGEGEIAEALDVTARTLHRDRLALARAVLDGLRAEGLGDREVGLTVGAAQPVSDPRPADRNSP